MKDYSRLSTEELFDEYFDYFEDTGAYYNEVDMVSNAPQFGQRAFDNMRAIIGLLEERQALRDGEYELMMADVDENERIRAEVLERL